MSSFYCGLQFRVKDGADKGRVIPLEHRDLTIGKARIAGDRAPGWVLLSDPAILRIHAEMAWNDAEKAYHLIARPDAPTEVNDEPVASCLVQVGDLIKFGSTVLVLQAATAIVADEPRQAVASVPDPGKTVKMTRSVRCLEVLSGVRKGERLKLSGSKIQFGGDQPEVIPVDRPWWDQDLVIQDPSVPFRCMSWHWHDEEKAYQVSMLRQVPVPVSFERAVDGVEWMSEMPSGRGAFVMVRSLDRVLLGKTTLQLIIDEF